MHNRWHPDIAPVVTVAAGEALTLETEDGLAGQLTRESTHADCATLNLGLGHPLAGPVEIIGAKPGDVLEVEFLEYRSADFGVTAVIPGFGFLADRFTDPFLVKWEIDGDVARSAELPGVAVPAEIFAGVVGVAPSRDRLEELLRREERIGERGGPVAGPMPETALPRSAAAACARSRRARSEATSTSGNWSQAAGCTCRSTCRARSSRSATCTSLRVTERSAEPRSRSPVRSLWYSTSTRITSVAAAFRRSRPRRDPGGAHSRQRESLWTTRWISASQLERRWAR